MFAHQLMVTATILLVHPTLGWNCIKKLHLNKHTVTYHNLQPYKTSFLVRTHFVVTDKLRACWLDYFISEITACLR